MVEEKKSVSLPVKLGLVLYLLVCLAVFVGLRFPWDSFRGRMEETIGSLVSRPVSLGHVRSAFPFGLKLEGVSIEGAPFAREMELRPSLLPLLLGRLDMDVDALMTSGSLTGSVRTALGPMSGPLSVSARMDELDSQVLAPLLLPGLQLKGIVSGTIEFQGPAFSLREMGGRANVVWKNGYLPLPGSLLPLGGISFASLEVDSVMEKGLITLERADLTGDISGTVSGSVRIMEPLLRSRLNLTGEIGLPGEMAVLLGARPTAGADRVRFSLRGTLERPRFRAMNR